MGGDLTKINSPDTVKNEDFRQTENGIEDEDSLLLESLKAPFPGFNGTVAASFFDKHGLGVKAIGIEVDNVQEAWTTMFGEGAVSILEPTIVSHQADNLKAVPAEKSPTGYVKYAEVSLYGDVVLRLIESSKTFHGNFWPNFEDVDVALPPTLAPVGNYGLHRFDHIVGNLFDLAEGKRYIAKITGFHDFAQFVAEYVGTIDSGLNSVVLANNNEMVLLPLNEPTYGTKRKSQIQTYLEQNNGAGVQHMALLTDDIFHTVGRIRAMGPMGGFEFMAKPSVEYY